jgi:hypothetical protein
VDSIILRMRLPEDNLLYHQELGGGGRQKGESEHIILQRKADQSAKVMGMLPFKVTSSQSITLIFLTSAACR